MHSNIVKDIINIDKKAREEVAKLLKKKDSLDDIISKEADQLRQSFDAAIDQTIKESKQRLETDIEDRKKSELETYKKTLKNIHKQYEDHKDQWIEDIYEACIK